MAFANFPLHRISIFDKNQLNAILSEISLKFGPRQIRSQAQSKSWNFQVVAGDKCVSIRIRGEINLPSRVCRRGSDATQKIHYEYTIAVKFHQKLLCAKNRSIDF